MTFVLEKGKCYSLEERRFNALFSLLNVLPGG
jgi:hypothetical protein